MKWEGHVARIGEVEKTLGKRKFCRPRSKWDKDIGMDVQAAGQEC
jgi:hypothetical protein